MLFYGAPRYLNGSHGTSLFSSTRFASTRAIYEAVVEFGRRYYACGGNYSIIGVGTSNDTAYSNVNDSHGYYWADMVKYAADTFFANNWTSRIDVSSAWDAEPDFGLGSAANSWIHGYESRSGRKGVYTVHAASGCPQTGNGTVDGNCNNGWKQSSLYHLSWEHSTGLPFTQIYATSGANARQWTQIDLYGAKNKARGSMYHIGVMTQTRACRDTGNPCSGTNNDPHMAHSQMLNELNKYSETAQSGITYTSDISWNDCHPDTASC